MACASVAAAEPQSVVYLVCCSCHEQCGFHHCCAGKPSATHFRSSTQAAHQMLLRAKSRPWEVPCAWSKQLWLEFKFCGSDSRRPGMRLYCAYCVHPAWLLLSTGLPSRVAWSTPALYLAASGTHWCRHDSLFMCNFWRRLESWTTAPFSKQPLLLYKKQAVSQRACCTQTPIPSAPCEREIKGASLLPREMCKVRNPLGLAAAP